MNYKTTIGLAVLALAAAGGGHLYAGSLGSRVGGGMADIAPAAGGGDTALDGSPIRHTLSGDYLSFRYAQGQDDWKRAKPLMEELLKKDPKNKELIRQAMILAELSGDQDAAAQRGRDLLAVDHDDGLARLIVSAQSLAKGDYAGSLSTLGDLPKSDMSSFILPLLKGWAMAGQGKFDPEMFKGTTIHAYYGGLIAHYLKKSNDTVFGFAETILSPSGLTSDEVERAADLMAMSGHGKDALGVYKALQSQKGGSDKVADKIRAIEKGEDLSALIPASSIKTPAEGAAAAIFDVARILYQQKSDGSARIFAQMAIGLNPKLMDVHVLIASSYARNGQIDQAIDEYKRIPEGNPDYLATRHEAADLLAKAGRMDDAVALLRQMYEKFHDPDSLIRIGDLYRDKEDYKQAQAIYDEISAKLGSPVPAKYWYLVYAKGMTEERLGNWDKAEADLKAALADQPDQPYILNYLGYAWVDKGVHLDEAMKMLEKASSLRPDDGYITDSLGWAHYRAGQYAKAVPLLEQAVGILPYDAEINSHLGDAYWQVGRRVEARFQWERARNCSKDAKLSAALDQKLADGLPGQAPAKQAANSGTATAPGTASP